MTQKLMISYSRKQTPFVNRFYQELKDAGVETQEASQVESADEAANPTTLFRRRLPVGR